MVEVKNLPDILLSLDEDGMCEGMPFMPEMQQHCGKQFRVFKEVTKICDTIDKTGFRRLVRTLLLDGLRCDGAFHGGCQAGCLVFWKEQWLTPMAATAERSALIRADSLGAQNGRPNVSPACLEPYEQLMRWSRRPSLSSDGEEAFVCQITQLKRASFPIAWWDIRHYVRDVISGNRRLGEVVRWLFISLFNTVQTWRGGVVFPHIDHGSLKKTPAVNLHLQPGDLVRVRHEQDIINTLDANNKNRGMWFDVGMLHFSGGTFRVAGRAERIIDEKSGKMLRMTPNSPLILLEGVICRADYQKFCPRSEYLFWREAWLERVEKREHTQSSSQQQSVSSGGLTN
jgi:hypothetical protein